MPVLSVRPDLPRRPLLWGLLLSLLLYVGAGVLTAGHHHDNDGAVALHDCAVCLLSAATAAAVTTALSPLLRVPANFVAVAGERPAPDLAVATANARAPPALLI